MKQISTHLRDKLLLQAQEAHQQGLTKLGEGVIAAVATPFSPALEVSETFNYYELTEAVQYGLWLGAMQVANYHDLPNLDIQKMEPIIVEAAAQFIQQIERSYDVEEKLGPFEEKVMGQTSSDK